MVALPPPSDTPYVEALKTTFGVVSSSVIVRGAILGTPKAAPVGLLKLRVRVSADSFRASSMIETQKLWLVWPGAKVKVPLVAV